ncbi:MAG: MFS transporter permease [Rhodospirillales bacterium]|nr:MFS transporter permease [Rhodospirillales bacterium]
MSEWLTYGIGDFLLFSPRVYWRLFDLHNRAVWPLQVPALLLGVTILVAIVRPRPYSDRTVSAIMAAAWIWVAWSFLWTRYSTINWAVIYVVPAFALEGLLFLVFGSLTGRLRMVADRSIRGGIGLALFLYGLAVHPLTAVLDGRLFQAEIFGIAPDPLAISTLGLLTLATGGAARWLLLVPVIWCVVSGATLVALDATEAWIPFAAVIFFIVSTLGSRGSGRRSSGP